MVCPLRNSCRIKTRSVFWHPANEASYFRAKRPSPAGQFLAKPSREALETAWLCMMATVARAASPAMELTLNLQKLRRKYLWVKSGGLCWYCGAQLYSPEEANTEAKKTTYLHCRPRSCSITWRARPDEQSAWVQVLQFAQEFTERQRIQGMVAGPSVRRGEAPPRAYADSILLGARGVNGHR